jgi:hypothetical protein
MRVARKVEGEASGIGAQPILSTGQWRARALHAAISPGRFFSDCVHSVDVEDAQQPERRLEPITVREKNDRFCVWFTSGFSVKIPGKRDISIDERTG